ncbi:hypothetical protein ACQEVF_53820 [Nonomuraea polychroma]|uniref:hypothetical protein n=1 Tax=Nonomuraea polychroma TaxID=46176 RepID=UPI003D8DF49E
MAVSAEGPRGRKEYAITEAGLTELRHWITAVEPTRVLRSDMLLRVFVLAQVAPEQARAYLRHQAELAGKHLESIEGIRAFLENRQDNLSVYGRITLEYGLRLAWPSRSGPNGPKPTSPEPGRRAPIRDGRVLCIGDF